MTMEAVGGLKEIIEKEKWFGEQVSEIQEMQEHLNTYWEISEEAEEVAIEFA